MKKMILATAALISLNAFAEIETSVIKCGSKQSDLALTIIADEDLCANTDEAKLVLMLTGSEFSRPAVFCAKGEMNDLLTGEEMTFKPRNSAASIGFTENQVVQMVSESTKTMNTSFNGEVYSCKVKKVLGE